MFNEIIGNEQNKKLLTDIIKSNNIAHRYMFVGKNSIGKMLFAKEFAQSILCQAEMNNRPCGICNSCESILNNNNPDLAEKSLNRIPLDKLPDMGKAEVLYIKGKVHIAKKEYEVAANHFKNCLDLNPQKNSARVRLAMINLLLGISSRAEELLGNKEDSFSGENGYSFEDLRMCLAIDMHNANFSRAYNTCEIIGKLNIDNSPGAGFLELLANQPFFMFVSFLRIFFFYLYLL